MVTIYAELQVHICGVQSGDLGKTIADILPPLDPTALAVLFLLKICVEQVIIKKIIEE